MKPRWQERVVSGLADIGVSGSFAADGRLAAYLDLLDHWNRTINLTGLVPQARVRQLVVEPVWVASKLRPKGRYLDIGSGNGSPAVPWALCSDFESATLVESRARRAAFLEVLCGKLGLGNVMLRPERFERAVANCEAPDWVTLQGVRLDPDMLARIRSLSPRAQVVWFTQNPRLPGEPARRIEVPGSRREALVFGPSSDPN